MANPVEVLPSPIHGQGVFARQAFRAGDRILPIDDSRIVTKEQPLDPLKGELEHHQDYLGNRNVLMQEPERYINHCCEPNTYVKTFNGVRWVLAYRDIEPGDEITYDYCIDSYGDFEWACTCGHPKCRKVHNTEFFALPPEKLEEYLPLLDDWYVAWRAREVWRTQSASASTNAKNATLMTPFIVKNAVSKRRTSPGRTRECS